MKLCLIHECEKEATCGRYCSTHVARKQRLGSYTARKCYRCHKIVDDDTTTLIDGKSPYYCNDCLVDANFCVIEGCKNVRAGSAKLCRTHTAARKFIPQGKEAREHARRIENERQTWRDNLKPNKPGKDHPWRRI